MSTDLSREDVARLREAAIRAEALVPAGGSGDARVPFADLLALLALAEAVEGAPEVEVRSECHDSLGHYHVEPKEWPDEEQVMTMNGQTVRLVRVQGE